MSSDNFSNLSLGDSTDGNIEVSEIEWEGDINGTSTTVLTI